MYRIAGDLEDLAEWERAALVALCDSQVADYIAARQDAIWKHRSQNFDPIPGSLRFKILARAMTRCEACGVSNVERALHVDHIVPRSQGGSNDLPNLQALCDACNAQKKDKDQTDFHAAHASYADRDPRCPFCDPPADRVELSNELALVLSDRYLVTSGHKLIVPRRHTAEYLDLRQPEVNALQALLRETTAALRAEDPTVAGFNIGANNGAAAGQTIFHCHLHVIPRRAGDVEDPRGGVRGVIPGRQAY